MTDQELFRARFVGPNKLIIQVGEVYLQDGVKHLWYGLEEDDDMTLAPFGSCSVEEFLKTFPKID